MCTCRASKHSNNKQIRKIKKKNTRKKQFRSASLIIFLIRECRNDFSKIFTVKKIYSFDLFLYMVLLMYANAFVSQVESNSKLN